ncbi:MAG: hypothetical protein EOP45_02175 [Sphingobacteriaceae bacterium]|nr:MAG: hypothetical protein EOP45_02175 [Sphingobacteriaceae bacterium]
MRLRLNKLSFEKVLLCIVLFILSFLLTGILISTAKYLAAIPAFNPPDFIPDIVNPNKAYSGKELVSFMGVTLK